MAKEQGLNLGHSADMENLVASEDELTTEQQLEALKREAKMDRELVQVSEYEVSK